MLCTSKIEKKVGYLVRLGFDHEMIVRKLFTFTNFINTLIDMSKSTLTFLFTISLYFISNAQEM
jgi:hypothetical protein